jgi:streptogramin lyase
MKRKNLKILILVFFLLFSTFGLITPVIGSPDLVTSRTYTVDNDFAEGIIDGLEYVTVHDQLQLSKKASTQPIIWVPNEGEGTVSKVNTSTGDEIARYRVAPNFGWGEVSPSRTTVDIRGNCWVGVRRVGTVVKIGLYEIGGYIDHNGDGIIQTSKDGNGNGIIDGSELLPFGQDECVLFEVLLRQGFEGTYTPGTIPHNFYDRNHWSTSPRGLAVDKFNNLWAGTYSNSRYYFINGTTGVIDMARTEYIWEDGWDHYAYGAVIDKQGILWSATRPMSGYTHLLRIDPSTTPASISKLNLPHYTYGLGLDYRNHLFVSGWTHSALSKINVIDGLGAIMWTKSGPYQARGVACTEEDGHVWVASTTDDKVYRYDNDGNFKASIPVGNGPTGVAVDDDGKVWACNLYDNKITRIDPADNSFIQKDIPGSGGHYSYSDMTGIISRTITTKIGTWTVNFDSGEADTPWGKVSWNSFEPDGTSVTVRVRSSNDGASWSGWRSVGNDAWFSGTPDGRYLQIETTQQIITGDESPILYDLTVNVGIIQAEVDFDPDTLNRKSKGKWVTVYIWFLEDYDVSDIDISTVLLNGVVPAEEHPTSTDEGILMVKFNRSFVIDILAPGDSVEITITGVLPDGTLFEGTDYIRVIFANG